MGSMVVTGRSARLIIARDKLDIDRFGSFADVPADGGEEAVIARVQRLNLRRANRPKEKPCAVCALSRLAFGRRQVQRYDAS